MPPNRKPKKPGLGSYASDREYKKRTLAEDVAAYEALCARAREEIKHRPPMPRQRDTRTAGELALARDIRTGAYRP